jgi:serine/threonine protein kinase
MKNINFGLVLALKQIFFLIKFSDPFWTFGEPQKSRDL